ncbi:hypothetical protein L226DRAFT_574362 [Lentinus tigrinus ALCF2SS1-7]|uniref:uncharacterized protein n=1 Tax=Lentinus tigrinus ALCF2SS1-7 TaxID=1328758 RepID=UPI001165E718|nr:hypothetical protein L226DRAFT_574362 [Lentinus tigrinus ALCF2SS1-7]
MMYVFGGKCKPDVGSDMFAVLDIERKTWRRITGAMDDEQMVPTHEWPGPRKNLASWVDGKQEKICYVFASSDGFVYDDCWSWNIAKKEWRRERVAGNFPCPRAEMSVCYNPKINSTIMFGGYNPIITSSFPTYRAQGQLLTDPATGKLYLFGGYTTTDWVLAGKSEVTRSHRDI